MEILIFKTNINTKLDLNRLSVMLRKISGIIRWSLDMEDVDRVLRIEVTDENAESEIIRLANNSGIYCAPILD